VWLAGRQLLTLLGLLSFLFKTSAELRLENLALRHQLGVLRRSAPKQLKLTPADRMLWVWLRHVWPEWKSALLIVQPATVIAWHRKGLRLFWSWKIQHGQRGRPAVPQEILDLSALSNRLGQPDPATERASDRSRDPWKVGV